MIRTCPKCGDFYADGALAFCLVDGTPLIDVEPGTEIWSEGERVIEEKENTLRTRKRKLKWRRILSSAITTVVVTLVVCVVAVNSLIYLRPRQPEAPVNANIQRTPCISVTTQTEVEAATPTPTPTPTPVCSDADKSRERDFIIKEFGEAWRREIESDRPKIIAENLPAGALNGEAGLSPLGFESIFSDACTTVSLTVRYLWEVRFNLNGTIKVVPISKQRKFTCAKAAGAWRCS